MARGVEARRIAYSLASAQAGVLARRQLIGSGLSSDLIGHWLRSGHIFKFLPGVYSLGRPADAIESFWMAGVLFTGEGSILAGESAARAWGMTQTSTDIEVVRPNGVRKRIQGKPPHDNSMFVVRRGALDPFDFAYVGPVPMMDPARLLIDLAGKVTERRLRRFFIEAGREGLLTPQCLSRIETRSRKFRGRDKLLALHAKWDPSTGKIRSVLEGEFKLMCVEQHLPTPLSNQRVGRYEVDALWEEAKLIVELDGRKFHSDAVALADDSVKTRYLRSLDYRVLRFTWNDVVERPQWVASQIRRELGSIYMGIAHTN